MHEYNGKICGCDFSVHKLFKDKVWPRNDENTIHLKGERIQERLPSLIAFAIVRYPTRSASLMRAFVPSP